MTHKQINQLVDKYFNKENYTFNYRYEHRLDEATSSQMYSLIRKFKPRSCLSFGTWEGGSAAIIYAALIKNGKDFRYVASELLDEKRFETINHLFTKYGTVPSVIGKIEKDLHLVPEELDFVYIDTDHDLENTKWYIKNILPRIKKGSLVAIHDWAVAEQGGKLVGKGIDGAGGWEETDYLMKLYTEGKLPLEKLYWNYEENGRTEGSFWIKK